MHISLKVLLGLNSEFATLLASGQLQTIHSSVLHDRGGRQHYATGCCVTLLYVSNVIFLPSKRYQSWG